MTVDFSEAWQALQNMANAFIARTPHILVALVVFSLFYFVGKLLRAAVRRLSIRRRRHRNLGLVLGRATQAGLVSLGLLVALVIAIPTFKPGQLVQLLGITGIAIGFAFRDILQNFLAGILLLITEPFRIDDQISVEGLEGTVEDIQTRATTIRTYDGRRIVIPNANLFTKSVVVNTAYDARRLEYDFGIGYGDDVERARALMLRRLQELPDVLEEPAPDVLVVGLEPSSVTLRGRWWIQPPRRSDALDSIDHVVSAIKQDLLAHGIDLPFPTQHVLFHDQTEETDGDRSRQREGWPAGEREVPKARSIGGALRHLAAQIKDGGQAQRGESRTSAQILDDQRG